MTERVRDKIVAATIRLIRERGITHVTTREIAREAGVAEGSITKNFGGKAGLLVDVLTTELPELGAWRVTASQTPRTPDELRAVLVTAVEHAVTFYRAALPLVAAAIGDRALADAYRATNAARGTGPFVAVGELEVWLAACLRHGALPAGCDPHAVAVAYCGAAQLVAWQAIVAGTEPDTTSVVAVVAALVPDR